MSDVLCIGTPLCNMALNKPAFQISETSDYNITYPAYLANDGSRVTSLQAGSCAVSGYTENPWWAVDLGYSMRVEVVRLTSCKRNQRCYCIMLIVAIRSTPSGGGKGGGSRGKGGMRPGRHCAGAALGG